MNRKQYTALAFALVGAAALSAQAVVAKDLTVAVYSAFTTLDPYDASDTLSQNVAKSFYEGLFGFDKDMKLVNVGVSGFLCLGRLFQGQPNEAALCI